MNLSPEWVSTLTAHGVQAVHWSSVGDARASDSAIMQWAREHEHIVFTHDLDFSAPLASTRADGPSVLQVRSHNILPEVLINAVLAALSQHERSLEAGALVVVEPARSRVRVLPL